MSYVEESLLHWLTGSFTDSVWNDKAGKGKKKDNSPEASWTTISRTVAPHWSSYCTRTLQSYFVLQPYSLESLDIINPLNFKFQRIFSPPAPRLAVQCISVSVHWVEINFSTNLVIARQSFLSVWRVGCTTLLLYCRQVSSLEKLWLYPVCNTRSCLHFWHQLYSSSRHLTHGQWHPDCKILCDLSLGKSLHQD